MTEKQTESNQNSGAIWNPNAAANWSLLFSPLFGSYIHALNWRTLGEETRAKSAMIWFYVMLALIIVTSVAGIAQGNSNPGGIGFVLLLVWYFFAARVQMKYVKEKFGTDYARRSWSKPLGIGFMAIVGFVWITFVFESSTETNTIKMVQNGKLDSCQTATVGKMVDSFMGSPAWAYGVSAQGQTFVNITGEVSYAGKPAKTLLQFVVNKDNKSFQYNALEFDGVAQTTDLANSLFTKMCESATQVVDKVSSTKAESSTTQSTASSLITEPLDGYKDLKFGESAKTIMKKLEKVCNLEGTVSMVFCKPLPALGLPGMKIFGQTREVTLIFAPSKETSDSNPTERVKLAMVLVHMGTFNEQAITTLITALKKKYSVFKTASEEESQKFDSGLTKTVDIVQYAKGSVALTFLRQNGNIDMYIKYVDISKLPNTSSNSEDGL